MDEKYLEQNIDSVIKNVESHCTLFFKNYLGLIQNEVSLQTTKDSYDILINKCIDSLNSIYNIPNKVLIVSDGNGLILFSNKGFKILNEQDIQFLKDTNSYINYSSGTSGNIKELNLTSIINNGTKFLTGNLNAEKCIQMNVIPDKFDIIIFVSLGYIDLSTLIKSYRKYYTNYNKQAPITKNYVNISDSGLSIINYEIKLENSQKILNDFYTKGQITLLSQYYIPNNSFIKITEIVNISFPSPGIVIYTFKSSFIDSYGNILSNPINLDFTFSLFNPIILDITHSIKDRTGIKKLYIDRLTSIN